MSNHTPGPWHVSEGSDHGIVTADKLVAMVTNDEDYPVEPDEQLANARLIAAAPELLAAIKGLLDAGEYDDDGHFVIRCTEDKSDGDFPDYIEAPSLRAANLAIAKAEGRSDE